MSDIVKFVPAGEKADITMIGDKVLSPDEVDRLKAMNKRYIQVVVGGKHRILIYKPCSVNGLRASFESVSEFRHYFTSQPPIARMNCATAWLKWQGKAFYPDGVSYHPCPDTLPKTVYNTFRPFPCRRVSGDVSLIIDHIEQVLCGGEEKASDYFIGWLAHLFQRPSEKPTVAVLMKSVEGTGKGTLYRLLSKIMGPNAYQVNGDQQITGRFNSVIAGKLLLFADEVNLTDNRAFDAIKGIISEPVLSLEPKGLEPESVPNFARFIFAGNHERILRAGTRERRFLVLEPTNSKVGDTAYWRQLNAVIDSHGAGAFYDYLLSVDLSDFDPYKAPATRGLIQEKLSSLSPTLSFAYEELLSERPFSGVRRLTAGELSQRYEQWTQDTKLNFSMASVRTQIGKLMSDLGIKVLGRSGRGDGKYYELPDTYIMRRAFASHLGHDVSELT